MKSWGLSITGLICLLGCLLWVGPVWADTNYRADTYPTITDGGFQQVGCRVTIEGTTMSTFIGDSQKDRAEFRLPPDFYIKTVGESVYGTDFDVSVQVGQGFNSAFTDVVSINPIDPSSSNPDQYRGFELFVNKPSGSGNLLPQLIITFNRVYVPKGATGNVVVKVDRSGNSAFSSGNFTIAQVATQRLDLSTEKTPSVAPGSQVVMGPIVVTENVPGAFQSVELALPTGFTWTPGSAVITPALGLGRDYDGDGVNERDYKTTVSNEKRYGQSTLRVDLTGAASTVAGSLRIECGVDVDDTEAVPGSIIATVAGSASPASGTLTIGTYSLQTVSVTADVYKPIYSGLLGQEIANFNITELVPGTLIGGRKVVLSLPSWAKWDVYPTVQVQGITELAINGGQALPMGNGGNQAQFTITQASQKDTGTIILKDAKVSMAVDAPPGGLKVTVGGSAGASGEVTVGMVTAPVTVSALSCPSLLVGRQNQQGGDIEIKESAGRVLPAKQLWLEFPGSVTLAQSPQVKATGGNLIIGQAYLQDVNGGHRLVIPIDTASSSPGTISVTNIFYNVGSLAADGNVEVKIGGPAVNEVNQGDSPLFFAHKWLGSAVNAVIGQVQTAPANGVAPDVSISGSSIQGTPVPGGTGSGSNAPAPVTRNILFFLGDKTYRVNGQPYQMDVAPFLDHDRIFIPLRYAGMALGIQPENILWDSEKQVAVLFNQNTMVKVNLGENAVYRFETKIAADDAAHLNKDRVMISLREITKAFGASVEWDADNQMVRIIFRPF